jgi:hypothetical protein
MDIWTLSFCRKSAWWPCWAVPLSCILKDLGFSRLSGHMWKQFGNPNFEAHISVAMAMACSSFVGSFALLSFASLLRRLCVYNSMIRWFVERWMDGLLHDLVVGEAMENRSGWSLTGFCRLRWPTSEIFLGKELSCSWCVSWMMQ